MVELTHMEVGDGRTTSVSQARARARSTTPSSCMTTEDTDGSCRGSKSTGSLSSVGSSCVAWSKENRRQPSTLAMSTAACCARTMTAWRFSSLTRDSISVASTDSLTRSVLLSMMVLAKSSCWRASLAPPASLLRIVRQSTTVSTPCRCICLARVGSAINVCATGEGSARPVVSISMWSSGWCRSAAAAHSRCKATTRSSLREQQRHPFSSCTTSSAVTPLPASGSPSWWSCESSVHSLGPSRWKSNASSTPT
mmetsp:Transcript_10723/g.31022  ORF Transcript_10723/g.31022 Transcript_10723/m.31022 type:complete len:253 (+) Transcript_10723:976-1734(+)